MRNYIPHQASRAHRRAKTKAGVSRPSVAHSVSPPLEAEDHPEGGTEVRTARGGLFLRLAVLPAGAALLFLAPGGAARGRNTRLDAARAQVEQRIAASGADVAVVLRTLDGKERVELNPRESFHAASTMKLGVMLELFRQVRAGKLRMEDALPVRNEFHSVVDGSAFQLDSGDDSDAEPYKKVGGTMTVGDLCEAMITRSSNLATNLLMEKLGIAHIARTVKANGGTGLNIVRVLEDGKAYEKGINNTTTAEALAALLLRMAHGRAVSAESSRQMVEILKRQSFNEAIPAGLPPGTVVAHKTGEITKIHHDAAIVYAPRPFVLVILVRGIAEREKSSALMAEITRILYGAVEAGMQ
jgi:beta-lactamase class A